MVVFQFPRFCASVALKFCHRDTETLKFSIEVPNGGFQTETLPTK